MKNIYPVSCRTASETKVFAEKEELPSRLKEVFADQNFWVELTLANDLTLICFGNRNTLTLRQIAEDGQQAFCLSKRKQTFHQLEADGKSVDVLHHQVLQQEDAELILLNLLDGKDVPDAYHLEEILS